MPRYAPNKLPSSMKKRYFELVRHGLKGAAAACVVGVSTTRLAVASRCWRDAR